MISWPRVSVVIKSLKNPLVFAINLITFPTPPIDFDYFLKEKLTRSDSTIADMSSRRGGVVEYKASGEGFSCPLEYEQVPPPTPCAVSVTEPFPVGWGGEPQRKRVGPAPPPRPPTAEGPGGGERV